MSVFRASSSEVSISILLRKCHTLSTCSVRPRSSLSSWPLSTRRSLSITTYLNDQNSGKRETSSNRRQGFGGRSDNFNFLAARVSRSYVLTQDQFSCRLWTLSQLLVFYVEVCQNRPQIRFYYVIISTSVLFLRLLWRRKLYNNYQQT